MICPNCNLYISDPSTRTCPRCGQPQFNRPDSTPGSDPFAAGPTSPYGQPYQPGYPPPAGSQWMQPALAPAPAKPARQSSRRRRNLISLIVFIVLVAACAGWGYLAFSSRGITTSNNALPPNVLFSDSLASNANGWGDNNGHCFFQDNAYHIKNNYICYAPAGDISDANVTVQAKQVAGSLLYPYGIVFRRTSTGNWYEFDIDSNSKWTFVKTVNETTTTLIDYTPNTAIKGGLNTVNTLRVQIKGTHFVFFVNGTQVGQADDTTFASGLTGLSAGGDATEVAYTNFEITKAS
jgi:hypothetical protein